MQVFILTIFFLMPNSGGIVHSQQFGYPTLEVCKEFGDILLSSSQIFGYTCQEANGKTE